MGYQDTTIINFANPDRAGAFKDALARRGRSCRLIAGPVWLKEAAEPPPAPLLFYFGSQAPQTADLEQARLKVWDQPWRAVVDGPAPRDLPQSLLMPPRFLLWPEDRDTIVEWLGQPTADGQRLGPFAAMGLIGQSPKFTSALHLVRRFARCDAPVLITGETGTGKELVARAIHRLSARAPQRFVPINCGAIPESLIESELFGHARGAFTDAKQASEGLAAHAEGGTMMFDELEGLTPKGQVALLRFMQDRRFRPVGGQTEKSANVRVIAATNGDVSRLADAGGLRTDLLYRLSVLALRLPSLRERPEDVEPLATHFIASIAESYGVRPKAMSPAFRDSLHAHDWPGNVRELENHIHRAFLLADADEICVTEVGLPGGRDAAVGRDSAATIQPYHSARAAAMQAFETAYLKRLMAIARGNVTHAARLAGTERRSLGRMLKRNGLHAEARYSPAAD